MNDPIKIIWKYKNNNRRTQYNTYIFIGDVSKSIKKILDKSKSYFSAKKEISSKNEIDSIAEGETTDNVDLSNAMTAYTAAISKTKDRIKIGK